MMAAFADAAPAWAAAGIVPLPVYPDGKKTMVKQPEAFGRPAAMGLAGKPRYAAANLGFMCGSHNRLTVVDIDSPSDAELQYALETYGESPIIVSTPSGGRHVYYAHNDEPRGVRLDERHPIDMLGGGLCVAPPSVRPSGASYAWLRGGLADIANGLPKIRSGAIQKREPAGTGADVDIPISDLSNVVPIGRRNDTVFRLALALAHGASSQDELLTQARKANSELSDPPLPDAEVQRAVGSAWRYKLSDRLLVPGTNSAIILPAASIARLLAAGETDAMALLALLRKHHGGRRRAFAASPEAMAHARLIGSWNKRRYREAARKLCELGELAQVSQGGKGKHTPSLYRFSQRDGERGGECLISIGGQISPLRTGRGQP
jgi:hypothetical protein